MDQQDERPAPAPEVDPKPSEQAQLANQENGHRSVRRYTTTPKKLATNRKNAQRSTGPRTRAGKLAISLNALKHGILAKEIVQSGGALGESPEDFESLLSGLIEAFNPVGKAEELAVEEIAVIYVRRARTLRAELAEIQRAKREAEDIKHEQYTRSLDKSPPPPVEFRKLRDLGENLAPAWVLEHTIRYEALLDRQLMRAVQWLEMLQQRRRSLKQQKS